MNASTLIGSCSHRLEWTDLFIGRFLPPGSNVCDSAAWYRRSQLLSPKLILGLEWDCVNSTPYLLSDGAWNLTKSRFEAPIEVALIRKSDANSDLGNRKRTLF
jgi:hypothetical protein